MATNVRMLIMEIEDKNRMINELESKCDELSSDLDRTIQEKYEQMKDLQAQETQRMVTNVSMLIKEIDDKNRMIDKLKTKETEMSMRLDKVMKEKDHLLEDMIKLQRVANNHFHRLYEENESLKCELESQMQWAQELEALEAEINLKNHNVTTARESLKRKLLEEETLGPKNVEDYNSKAQEESDALRKQLEAKTAELDELRKTLEEKTDDSLVHTLMVKERKTNDQLQEARKAVISDDFFNQSRRGRRGALGIKRMGGLNEKVFRDACSKKFRSGEWDVKDGALDQKAAELCSSWQEKLQNSQWNPFKRVDGELQEVIDEKDEKLSELKRLWGDEVYDTVIEALLEMNEYNASGRYAVPEIWNFKEERKASLKEVIEYLLKQLKNKRRRL